MFSYLLLNFHRTARCIDRAGELDQHAVAGGLDDATAVRGNPGIDKLLPKRLQLRKRALLIAPHQPAIAGDVRRQHSRQSSSTRSLGKNAPWIGEIYSSIKA